MDKRQDKINAAFLEAGQIAVSDAIWAALRVFARPWAAREASTSLWKSTEKLRKDDPTEPIDLEATIAIIEVLRKASQTPRHPLSGGFLLHNEEAGLNQFNGIGGAIDEELIVFVDPIDYTDAATRGLDGSVLMSFYLAGSGLCAAVIGDLYRRKIYWRKAGDTSKAMSIIFRQDPTTPFLTSVDQFSTPTGESVPLTPSGRTKLDGSSINLYTGKPERVDLAAKNAGDLWTNKQHKIKCVFSVGGSLGTVRVGEGILDASIEVAKGFRPWDFMPGAFIAQGAGAHVIDLEGKPIDLGPGFVKDEWIKARFEGKSLEDCRQKFIVAATKELADEILSVINGKAKGDAKKKLV